MVFQTRDWFKMVRIHTKSCSADVVNLKIIWNQTDSKLINNAMCLFCIGLTCTS